MPKETIEEQSLSHLLKAVSHLIHLPKARIYLNYDEEVDALYVHFQERPDSTHSEMRKDGVILDYKNDALVGVTILEASHR